MACFSLNTADAPTRNMDQNTQQLIEKLAEKLGTTAEHLWEVLIRQAPITSAIELAMDAMLLVATYQLWKFLWNHPWKYEEYGCTKELTLGAAAVFTAILIISIALSIPSIFAGFLNPEYWALQQIIH